MPLPDDPDLQHQDVGRHLWPHQLPVVPKARRRGLTLFPELEDPDPKAVEYMSPVGVVSVLGQSTSPGNLLAARATSDNGQTGVGTPWGKTTTTFAQATNLPVPNHIALLGLNAPTAGSQALHYVFGTLKKSPSNRYFLQVELTEQTAIDATWGVTVSLAFVGDSAKPLNIPMSGVTQGVFKIYTATLITVGDPTTLGSEVLVSAAGGASMVGTIQVDWIQVTPLP